MDQGDSTDFKVSKGVLVVSVRRHWTATLVVVALAPEKKAEDEDQVGVWVRASLARESILVAIC